MLLLRTVDWREVASEKARQARGDMIVLVLRILTLSDRAIKDRKDTGTWKSSVRANYSNCDWRMETTTDCVSGLPNLPRKQRLDSFFFIQSR